MNSTRIRAATEADLPEIRRIYNEAIETTTATFDTELKTLEDRRAWLTNRKGQHPVVVIEEVAPTASGAEPATEPAKILGWASLSPWAERAGYRVTAEPSLYLGPEARGKGLGRKLMEWVTEEATRQGFRSLISRIDATNRISIDLHLKFGFQRIGTLHQAGYKFGRLIDVDLLQWMNPGFQEERFTDT